MTKVLPEIKLKDELCNFVFFFITTYYASKTDGFLLYDWTLLTNII